MWQLWTNINGNEPNHLRCFTATCLRRKWRAVFDTAGTRDLFSSTSVVATWDDHEVYNDFAMTDTIVHVAIMD